MKRTRTYSTSVMKTRRRTALLTALLLAGGMASAQVVVEGNVFGGGNLGQVTKNTTVTVNDGTIGRKLTLAERKNDENGQITRIRFGNVYGGGNGYDGTDYSHGIPSIDRTLGLVKGNTFVTIKGSAVVRHAVYGGGNLGTVGVCTVNEGIATYTSGGECHVTIEGNALIGPTKADLTEATSAELTAAGLVFNPNQEPLTLQQYNDTAFKYLGGNEGWVFGSSRGIAGDELKNLSFADSTIVTIKGNAQVVGNVFGGGENGHVQKGTNVLVQGNAIIGGIPLHGGGSLPYPYTVPAGTEYAGAVINGGFNELYEDAYGVGRRIFRGNVFGGGKGNDYVPWALPPCSR